MVKTSKSKSTKKRYTAEAIEVLSGLDPVKRRPGMYTDTMRPNHLAHEAIDNSVDEAIAGFARHMDVTLYKDRSLKVVDDGRGMPTDIHPEHKLTGVELILTRLHAGAKFSSKTYEFSGGLHGVGISVVNALSTKLIVQVKKTEKFTKWNSLMAIEKVNCVRLVLAINPKQAQAFAFGLIRNISITLSFRYHN